jgi:hypothetical protein
MTFALRWYALAYIAGCCGLGWLIIESGEDPRLCGPGQRADAARTGRSGC